MGLFGKNIFDIISDGGIVPKSPTTRFAEKVVQSVAEKAIEKITSKFNTSENTSPAEFGDVIGVRRTGYKHFGVYVNDFCIIHYASHSGDFGGNICIHETTLDEFLDGSSAYFVCGFPKAYGKPNEMNIRAALSGSSFAPQWENLFNFLKRNNYNLYSPGDTVQRARSRLNESKYNLITNNCEHFAIWCKTGISESHQVNDLLDGLPMQTIYT